MTTALLQNLSSELESDFTLVDSTQFESNLKVLTEQLELLVSRINQNPLIHNVLPDIVIARQIKEIEHLSRETTQVYRNYEAAALAKTSLDKEIRRRKRELRKLRRETSPRTSTKTSTPLCEDGSFRVQVKRSYKLPFRLSPIRESIPLPPPSRTEVNFRFGGLASSRHSSSTLDTDETLEFDLVWV